MKLTLKQIFKAVSKQNEFIQDVLKKRNIYAGLSIAFFGIFFYSVLERFSSFGEQKFTLLQIVRIIILKLISTGVFLTFSIFLMYGIVRIFKGKKDFKTFLIARGWGGIYILFFTVLIVPVRICHFIKLGPLFYVVSALPIGASVIASLIVVFYFIKYEVLTIRRIFNFSVVKAVLIWVVAFIPSFYVYTSFPMLIDKELRDYILQEYEHYNKRKQNANYNTESTDLKK